jgi:beta-glucosidase
VEFTVTPETLSILNLDMHRVVEPGVFEMMVGPSSDKTDKVLLTVEGIYRDADQAENK